MTLLKQLSVEGGLKEREREGERERGGFSTFSLRGFLESRLNGEGA